MRIDLNTIVTTMGIDVENLIVDDQETQGTTALRAWRHPKFDLIKLYGTAPAADVRADFENFGERDGEGGAAMETKLQDDALELIANGHPPNPADLARWVTAVTAADFSRY